MIEETNLTELINNEKIADIIESKDHLTLAKFLGREFCNFTPDDEKYVDIFWDSAFNKSWIYVSEEMVCNQFGYKKGKQMMSDFYRKLSNAYDNHTDYKEVNKGHDLVKHYYEIFRSKKETRGGALKKYYIITGETYKGLLASAQTMQGKLTRKYFIKIESLANITNQAIFKYMELVKNKQSSALNRLHEINVELLTYKKLSERNESIYIVSTYEYVTKGLFKIGRTKNFKSRNASHNTTRVMGDKVKILHEFKVNDSVLVESVIHKKLAGLRPDKKSEFFMCPYDLLFDIVDMIIRFDEQENEAVDKIIDAAYKLKQKDFKCLDWTCGLDMSIFETNMKLIENTNSGAEITAAQFDMTAATDGQKEAFVRDCILAYQKNVLIPQKLPFIVWSVFQGHLIEKLRIPKSQFKALEWREPFKTVAKENKIDIKLQKR